MREDSSEKHAQSVQHANRMRLLRPLLGLGMHRQADQELQASGSKSEDGERVKGFFDSLDKMVKDEWLHFPAHRFLWYRYNNIMKHRVTRETQEDMYMNCFQYEESLPFCMGNSYIKRYIGIIKDVYKGGAAKIFE